MAAKGPVAVRQLQDRSGPFPAICSRYLILAYLFHKISQGTFLRATEMVCFGRWASDTLVSEQGTAIGQPRYSRMRRLTQGGTGFGWPTHECRLGNRDAHSLAAPAAGSQTIALGISF